MRLRLESVQNATDYGRHVASMILGGHAAYDEPPWFWTHQGPLRLQIAGLAQPGDDTVISGDVHGGRFSVFCFRDERLVAVESLNRPADQSPPAASSRRETSRHPTRSRVPGSASKTTPHSSQESGFRRRAAWSRPPPRHAAEQ
jgi:Reductase C-terminal